MRREELERRVLDALRHHLMDLYFSEAISIETVKERGSKLEARKTELKDFLATAEAPPPLLHPQMAEFYHRQIARLHDMLHSELDEQRQEAAEVIRSLIEAIILTPSDKRLQIDVRGDLAGILTMASGSGQTKTPARFRTGVRDALASQVQMVAGACFPRCHKLTFLFAANVICNIENTHQFAA